MCMYLKVRFLHNNSIVCAQYFAYGILWGNCGDPQEICRASCSKKINPYGHTHNIHTVHTHIYICIYYMYVHINIHTKILHTHIFLDIQKYNMNIHLSACTHAIQCNTICHRAILGKPIFENRPKTNTSCYNNALYSNKILQ